MPPAGYPAFLQYLQSGRVRRIARAADAERPWRSGRMSRERIAKSLSGLVVTVAMAVTLAGSFVLGDLILSRELFLRRPETDRESSLDEVLATSQLLPWRPRRRAKAPRAMVLDALQHQPPLHILNARDSDAAEFPSLSIFRDRSRARPLGQAERRPSVRRTPGEFQDHADRDR